MTNSTETVTGPLVQAIEAAWAEIQNRHPEVPNMVVTIASGKTTGGMNHGHFAPKAWVKEDGTEVHELFLGGESLKRGPIPTLGTMLHEAAHALANARGIQDTSNFGRYHNGKFAKLAAEMGIDVEKAGNIGFSSTTVPQATADAYTEVVEALRVALSAYRKTDGARAKKVTNNGVVMECSCDEPRKMRCSLKVANLGPIVCGICDEEFLIVD